MHLLLQVTLVMLELWLKMAHTFLMSQVASRSPPIDNSVGKNKAISDAPCVLSTTSKKTMRYVICQDKEKDWPVAQKKKNAQIRKKTPTVIYGKATYTIIRAAFRKMTHIYLGDVDNDASNGDIIDWCRHTSAEGCTFIVC